MTVEIVIDPNLRIEGNRTFAEFTDVAGGFADDLNAGDHVHVVEEVTGLIADATVYQVDSEGHFIDLTVDWSSFRRRSPIARAEAYGALIRVFENSAITSPVVTTVNNRELSPTG